jgi:MFS family permease
LSTTATHHDVAAGYGELIRDNRNFRYLWFGQIISLLGDWFNLIASASLIATLTQSGFAVGSLFVVRMLAPFLVSPFAGVVADRYNRKYILIITDITRSLTVFCFLFIRDAGDIWLLYTLTAIQLGISGFYFPARNAILPDLVTPRELGAANALSSATWSVMLALGAAIGGLVSGIWGIYPAFTIDAITFILSAFLVSQVKFEAPPGLHASAKTVQAALSQYFDGLRYLGRHLDVLFIASHKGAISLLMVAGFQIVQVAIAERVFVMGEGGGISMGLMFGVTGIGTGIGPILIRYFTGDRSHSLRMVLAWGYLTGSLGLAISAPLISFGAVLLGTFIRGIGGGIIWVFSTQLLFQLVPAEVRGRVFATEFAIFTLMSAAGAALAGSGLDTPLGISGITWIMAGLILLPGIFWAYWINRVKSGEARLEDIGVPSSR